MTELLLNKGPMSDEQRLAKIEKLIKTNKLVTTGDRIFDKQGRELFVFRKIGDTSEICTPVGLFICYAPELHDFCKEYAVEQFKLNVDAILRNLDFTLGETDGTKQ